ncbi:Survival protein SurA precursor [Candidatus Enterovibrio escicola]|uniref:Chaperone SurA n=2 Tax=Candidatus Enterovibrio escicola TaxID=1927127 RepID=A0A2A5T1X3_9GAMM|nr:Survival protein SurA precursor [Candidatus Enterovibrio escacola]
MMQLFEKQMNKCINAILTIVFLAASLSVSASTKELDRVITVVNESVILSSEIDALKRTVSLNVQAKSMPPDDILQQQILDQLILEELQLQEATRLNIRIDDLRLDQAIEEMHRDNKPSIKLLHSELKSNGISWSQYRERIRREITISEVRNLQVRSRINILPQEIESLAAQLNEKNYAEVEYRISHIQLRLDENADKSEYDSVVTHANELVSYLNAKQDFTELALANSKGPKALDGGDWGWMRLEEMPTIFADHIGNNSKGSIIGPFRSGVGYHIIKITDLRGLKSVAATEVNTRHILIKPSIILSDEGAKRQLTLMIQQIQEGKKTFEELAQQYSMDSLSAVNGGSLGWQSSAIYATEFRNKIDSLQEAQISEPFKTIHGWHIAEVLGRRQADYSDAEIKNRAYRMLLDRKFNEEAQTWLKELRAGAYVKHVEDNNDYN